MFEEWVTFDEFPGTRVLMEPMDYVISLRVNNALAKIRKESPDVIVDGDVIRDVVEYVVKAWEHAPLQRGKFSEKFDRTHVRWLDPAFATAIYIKAFQLQELTDEETKNSESQST